MSDVPPAPEDLQALACWRHGPTPGLPGLCVHQLFERQVQATPEAVALVAGETRLTYGELNARANRLAHLLISHGVGPDRLVAVGLERGPDLVVCLLAILKAGGAYLPLDPAWPVQRLRQLIAEAGCSLLLTERSPRDPLTPGLRILHPGTPEIRAALREQPPTDPCRPSEPGQLAYLLFTSGSTGAPKGVLIEHRSILRLLQLDPAIRFGPGDTFLQLAPVSFDAATFEIWGALLTGARLVLFPTATPSLSDLARTLRQEAISVLWLTAGLFHAMVDEQPEALSRVRLLLAGGEELSRPHVLRLLRQLPPGHALINGYGPTENTTFSCCHRMAADGPPVGPSVPIGRPISHTSVHVLDRDLRPCGIGVVGELHLGGAGLARGYLNDPGLTAERFIADPFSADPSARLYRSGDLASWNADGTLAFHGRIDQQIKLRGYRIEPGEVERALLAHPGLSRAHVLCREDCPAGKRLVAYWVPAPAQDGGAEGLDDAELRDFLGRVLPAFMVPEAYVRLDTLPLTPNGKLDRRALPAPPATSGTQGWVPPSTPLGIRLHGLWAELLGHGAFGIHDSFFRLGGDSLAAARLVSRLEQSLGRAPSLSAFFGHPTIAALESLLADASGPTPSPEATSIAPAAPVPLQDPEAGPAYLASYAQTRLWFLHQLRPGLTAYHLPALWRLRGDLDTAVLAQALTALVERHPTLRSSFRLQGREVLQILHPPPAVCLRADVPGDRDPQAVIEEWLVQEQATPFDLSGAPLLRARLLRLSPEEHLLLLNHHHIASDGWSTSVLASDLVALYNAHRAGRPPQLQPLRVQYSDYAAWQRQRLEGRRGEALLSYWLGELQGLEPLEIPTDHPRPALPSHRGETLGFSIGPDLLAPFEALCRAEGATLQMGLLALVAVLLHRISGQDEIAIGIPHWGRNHPDLEPLIGFFINTLPIRSRWRPDQSFRQLLAQVRDTSLAAYDHQELPFERMVEALQLERDTSRNPLVQVMLQLLEVREPSLQGLEGLEAEALATPAGSARFDLEFVLRRRGNGLRGSVTFASDLFTADRIERMSGHLQTLLVSLLAAPDAAAAGLQLLPDTERQRIESWQRGPEIEVPDLGVPERFEGQVESTPEAIALVCGDRSLSYDALNRRADRLARELRELGVGPETIVAVGLERSMEMVVALLAVLKAGGAYLPLDPGWPQERRKLLLREAGCRWLVCAGSDPAPDGWALLALPAQPTAELACLRLARLTPQAVAGAEPEPPLAVPPGRRLAYLTYTSGSTGVPKAVAIEHRSILRLVDPANGFRLGAGEVVLQLAPLAFDAATFELWGPLLNGGTLALAPPGLPALAELADLLRRQGITTLWLTAGLFQAMVEEHPDALAGVAQVLAGGDVLPPGPVQRLLELFPAGHELINGYGPSENTTFTCCHRMAAGQVVDPLRLPIGRPIAGTVVRVLDPAGQPCPIGVPGELHIGGAGLARGYLNNPGLTAASFLPDPFSTDPSARLYRSGDLASWNADGTLAFHGRIDRQLKLRGFRIEPGEIEAHLLGHPAVAQAVVLLRHDDPAHPRLIAYWVAQAPLSAEQLREFLVGRLPEFMLPSAFVELEALPLTANGKLDRRALPAPSFQGDLQQRVGPSSPLQCRLHTLWSEVLGHGDFGITDNFFRVGGHSLAAARLVSRIEQELGVSLPLARLFQSPTLEELAGLVEGLTPASGGAAEAPIATAIPPIAPLEAAGGRQAYRASFAQARLWFLHQLQPGLTAYHMPALWRLRGDLDPAVLAQALAALVERHPTLRTSFTLRQADPLQWVNPAGPFPLAVNPAEADDLDEAAAALLCRDNRIPFDLGADPLLRGQLLRIAADDHLLLLTLHHIAGDGWSLFVLQRDLSELYNAILRGRPPRLAPLRVQYSDYAAWQRQRLEGRRGEALLSYWLGELQGLEPLEIPTDHPRPALPSHRGETLGFSIGPDLLAPFEALCRAEGATLQMGLLALVAVLLHRISGQDEIAIGIPHWGRNHPDLEPLIGFFINTLPIRSRWRPDQSFRQLLAQVRDTSLAAYDHQELPFERMVEALQLERDTSRNPLVQVMLQLIELPESSLRFEGVESESLPTGTDGAKVDLSFHFRHAGSALQAWVSYPTDLFTADRIERLSGHLQMLLQGIGQDPDRPLPLQPLLSPQELLQLGGWERGPGAGVPDLRAHQLFEAQAARTPRATALRCGEVSLSYEVLDQRANQLAHRLIAQGLGSGEIVGLCLPRSAELVVALLAVLKAGGAYLPLDPALPPARLAATLAQVRPSLVLTSDALQQRLGASGEALLVLEALDLAGAPRTGVSRTVAASSPAHLLQTSGSTGQPATVVVPHGALACRCAHYREVWPLGPERDRARSQRLRL